MTKPVLPTLVIVDDHELFRQGLQALLVSTFHVVGVGATSSDAITLCQALDPDILLLDVELGSDPAETTIRAIHRTNPGVVIIVLTMYEDAVLRRQLLQAGASDYVTKSVDHRSLAVRVERALLTAP